MTDQRLASIDIGTLTCRLLIADVSGHGQLKELHSERRILRLGEGVDQSKRLKREPMDRVIQCLREWRRLIDGYGVVACATVATSAVRDADNRMEFLDRIQAETGIDAEILTGEAEAQRTMLGIRSGLADDIADLLALDIGGGSTEFISAAQSHPPALRSIDLGVVRLSERLLHHDPPTEEEIARSRDWIKKASSEALEAMPPLRTGYSFVGTAGTITSLAAMAQRLPRYEPARIHNYRLSLETIVTLETQLLSRTKAERVGMPGLETGREDVIVAGAIILRTVMETLHQQECLVSDRGLREGVLIELAARVPRR